METKYKSRFYLVFTDKPQLYKIFIEHEYGSRMVGELSIEDDGILTIKTEKIHRYYNGFGIYKELLIHKSIRFNKIIIEFNGQKYSALKTDFLQKGISKFYPEGEKVYLSINHFNQHNHNQRQLDLFSEGV